MNGNTRTTAKAESKKPKRIRNAPLFEYATIMGGDPVRLYALKMVPRSPRPERPGAPFSEVLASYMTDEPQSLVGPLR